MPQSHDSLEPATMRDIRNLESIMLAGFEMCYEAIGVILENQEKGYAIKGDELTSVINAQRTNFKMLMDELRGKNFYNKE